MNTTSDRAAPAQSAFALAATLSVIVAAANSPAFADDGIRFSRDILPVLSENCFQCHGPDEANREAGLRLDHKAGAFQKLESGAKAVVAGQSQQSALFKRITSSDSDLRMPPADSGKSLSAAEIQTIKKWIDAGADWSGHWAFQAPQRPDVPEADPAWRATHPIDRFIQARLKAEQLSPADEADKETLIRRVTLDLTGLPPTLEEIDAFLTDDSPQAYERVVDRLLSSQRYGEHMARTWLDAARFADTHGLHLDNERSVWPYRDWVIEAFNRNQRFDEFTIEQLAGDLLPKPTMKQRVATGFNRCNVTTSEGGSIDEEYYVRYAVDRVETTATVWLGLTAGCAACHDHKFDPLKQREFYELFSYFFSLTERAMDGNSLLPPPALQVPSAAQQADRDRIKAALADIDKQIAGQLSEVAYADPLAGKKMGALVEKDFVWFDDALPPGAKPAGNDANPWKFVSAPDHPVFSGKKSSVRTATGLSQHFFTEASTKLKIGSGANLFAYVYLDPQNPPETVQLQFNDGNWEHRAFWGADKGHGAGRNNASNLRIGDLPKLGEWVRLEVAAEAVGLKPGTELNGWAFTQFGGTLHWDKPGLVIRSLPEAQQQSLSIWEQYRQQFKQPALPGEVQKLLDVAQDKRTPAQQDQLQRYFLQHVNPQTKQLFAKPMQLKAELERERTALEKTIPSTLVMEDRKEPRQAHILERGQYTQKRDKVSSAIPEWIAPPLPDQPGNRLGLARWLVSPQNPLTARVTVNRFWQHFFGAGIVTTSEDFGVQGAQPTHPELLDWLATEFVRSGWDMKYMHKLLVTSGTYRQSSHVDSQLLARDADNRLLARGPRFRLDAEVIRDQALSLSGLLVGKIGGRSVRPYQPAGLWKPVGFGGSNTSVFKQDTGEKLYRRSMYTFWKRTSPPPSMTTFDAPDRETCQVRRSRTNTPLQALVLMNDVQYVEAARKFAERVMLEGGDDAQQRITFAFRATTARRPTAEELQSITKLFLDLQRDFQQNPEAAGKLLSAGESPRNTALNTEELAAWTLVTHLLLNLSETVTRG